MHNQLLYAEDKADVRGNQLDDWVGETTLGIMNDDLPNRVTSISSIARNISITKASLLPTCSWAMKQALSSDHSLIHISITAEIKKMKAPKNMFINFKKADWEGLTKFT